MRDTKNDEALFGLFIKITQDGMRLMPVGPELGVLMLSTVNVWLDQLEPGELGQMIDQFLTPQRSDEEIEALMDAGYREAFVILNQPKVEPNN